MLHFNVYGELRVVKIGTADNVSDLLTKPIAGDRHPMLAAKLRRRNGSAGLV